MGGNPNLSNREQEVANLVKAGLQNRAIADQLFVSEKTIKFHLTNIYIKKGVHNRNQLVSLMLTEEKTKIILCPGIATEDIKCGEAILFDPSNGRTRRRTSGMDT